MKKKSQKGVLKMGNENMTASRHPPSNFELTAHIIFYDVFIRFKSSSLCACDVSVWCKSGPILTNMLHQNFLVKIYLFKIVGTPLHDVVHYLWYG